MKRILTLFFLLPFAHLFAQPVITSPSRQDLIGSDFVVTPADTTITPGLSGPNVVWDYKGMAVYGTAYVVYIDSTSGDTTSARYPLANLELDGPDNKEFDNLSDTSCVVYGTFDPVEFTVYTTGDKQIVYPVTYGSSWTSTYTGAEHSTAIDSALPVTGTRTIIADSWGTLITPYDTFTNVIRLASYGRSVYTLLGNTQTVYDTTFSWLVQGQIAPALSITHSALKGGDSTVRSKYTLLLQSTTDTLAGINRVPVLPSITVFPNPTDDLLYIGNGIQQANNYYVSIYDVTGRLDKEVDLGTRNIQVGVADLTAGYYMGVITDDKGTVYRFRFVKQ